MCEPVTGFKIRHRGWYMFVLCFVFPLFSQRPLPGPRLANRANQRNPNNDEYHRSRGTSIPKGMQKQRTAQKHKLREQHRGLEP